MHERGTMVEAYMGALYEQCHYRTPQELSIVLETMISQLRHFLAIESKEKEDSDSSGQNHCAQSSVAGPSQFHHQSNLKKAKSLLLEIMQKRGVTNACECLIRTVLSMLITPFCFLCSLFFYLYQFESLENLASFCGYL